MHAGPPATGDRSLPGDSGAAGDSSRDGQSTADSAEDTATSRQTSAAAGDAASTQLSATEPAPAAAAGGAAAETPFRFSDAALEAAGAARCLGASKQSCCDCLYNEISFFGQVHTHTDCHIQDCMHARQETKADQPAPVHLQVCPTPPFCRASSRATRCRRSMRCRGRCGGGDLGRRWRH